MSKRLLSLILALVLLVGSLGGVTFVSAQEPSVSKTTDFITSAIDIDEMLRREYIDNVPLGYSENVFSLYQPGWGFDRTDIYRTGTAAGWGMPVTVQVDGQSLGVQNAEFIPSYVTSFHTPGGSPTYANLALGAQQIVDALPTVWPSFDQTTWGCKLDYAFDGEIYGNGTKNWNTYAEPELRTGDEWVQIIFPQTVTLTAVKLHSYVDKADCGLLAGAVVQVWNGTDWENAANQVNPAFAAGENHITFDALTGGKFRIVLTPTEGKALAFDEIEFLDETGTNLALGAVKTDPETQEEPKELDPTLPTFRVSFDMANWNCYAYEAFDGVADLSSNGNWCTYGSTMPDGFEWLEITWPEEVTLDAVNLWVYDDGGNSRVPQDVRLQIWNGTDWQEVAGLKQPEGYVEGENLITFDQVTGTRFRLVFQPMEGKAIAIPEIEMLQEQPPKDVKITGWKYISPDDKAAVILQAENLGQTELTVNVSASSAAAATAEGNALTGQAAGFALKIVGDEGFAVSGTKLVKTVTLAPGEKAEFRVAMAIGDTTADAFLADADPLATQKETFNRWFLETIPYVDLPDEQIKQIYYFRWYTFRNHIRMTSDDYYIISEFLPNVGWAGKHNSINCPAGHHVAEARWLKNDEYLDDYLAHWLDYGGAVRSYSFWIANAYYERYLVNQDDYVLNYVEKLKKNYDAWTASRYNEEMGLYWQYDGSDGMELAVGGHGYRPTINAYQWADAMAIAEMCKLIGDEEGAAEYTQRAQTLKATMDEKLWDPTDNFYKLIRTGETERVDVREQIGYVPWMFNMPDDTEEYGTAWEALMSEDGFFSEYGPRTTELEYAARYPTSEYGTGMCRWDGPSWPFATSQTLVGMANLLNDYENQTAVDEADYFTILKTYAKSQYKNGAPWIAENLDADNGTWIADCWRSPNYNHSQFANLVISGLIGIRPDDTDVLTINPLTPDDWDYFCLENVPYHDRLVTIVYDRDGSRYGQGAGFQVYVDGEKLYSGDSVEEIHVELPEQVVSEAEAALEALYSANRARLESEYEPESWAVFAQAMENAEELLNAYTATDGELTEAYDALYKSLRYLVRKSLIRYEAEGAALTGLAKVGGEGNASGGQKVGTIDNAESSVTFTVTVPAAGEYTITVTADGDPAYPNPSHKVYVNGDGENYQIIQYPNPEGWGKWKEYPLTLTLKEGENTITFAFNDTVEKSFAQLDCIDVPVPPLDKTRLGELYDRAVEVLAGTEVLANAEAVLYDPDTVQSKIDAAADALEEALAQSEVPVMASGYSGDLTWELNEEGVLTFFGEGRMRNYGTRTEVPWNEFRYLVKSIVIPEGVTRISALTFVDMVNLESVQIPATVTEIGAYAFKNCAALTDVVLPSGLTKLGDSAFYGCAALTEVVIPAGVAEIGAYAFKNSGLVNVTLNTGLVKIGDSAFYGIAAAEILVPETVEVVGEYAFARSGLTKITFTGNAPAIGQGTFNKIVVTANYPAGNETWTEAVLQNYGGTVTWTAE